MCGGPLRSQVAEYCTHLFEYVLFFILTLFVWADGDLLRFLVERKRPGAEEFLWLLFGYSIVWILAGLLREPVAAWILRLRTERENDESRTQGAEITGQQAVQNS